jgi:hypothetical protein
MAWELAGRASKERGRVTEDALEAGARAEPDPRCGPSDQEARVSGAHLDAVVPTATDTPEPAGADGDGPATLAGADGNSTATLAGADGNSTATPSAADV